MLDKLPAELTATLAAAERLVRACTPADTAPNDRGEIRSVRTPDWTDVAALRDALNALAAKGSD